MDRFGNLQLAATVADARVAGIPLTGRVELAARLESGRQTPTGCRTRSCPTACSCAASTPSASSQQGEFGLLVDANGHLAVVAGEASAAALAQRGRRGVARSGLVRAGHRQPVWCRREPPRYHPTQ